MHINLKQFFGILIAGGLSASSLVMAEDFSQLQGVQKIHEQSKKDQAQFNIQREQSDKSFVNTLAQLDQLQHRIDNNDYYMRQDLNALIKERVFEKQRIVNTVTETIASSPVCQKPKACSRLKFLENELQSEIQKLNEQRLADDHMPVQSIKSLQITE